MIYKVNHQEFLLLKGDALFGNTGTLHTGSMFDNQDCEYTSITFDQKLIFGYENSLVYTKYVKPIVQNGSRHYDRIRNILTFIEQNYSSKITLEDIADCIHVCKEECSRIFKRQMNLTLFEFLLQYRIEKSVDYLIHTKYSINTIAESVGFQDSNYFTKVFRKQKGCSPTKYRQSICTEQKLKKE